MEDGTPESSWKDQCIWNIITETAEKIKLGLILPRLLANDGEILKGFLSPGDHKYVLSEWSKHSLTTRNQTCDIGNPDLLVTNVIRQGLLYSSLEHTEDISKLCGKTFPILQNQDLVNYCDENLATMISAPGERFLRLFEKLKDLPTQKTDHFSKKLSDDLKNNQEQSDLARKAEQELVEVQIKYEDQKSQVEEILDEKQRTIDDYKMKLDAIRHNVSKNIGKIIERSEEKIMLGIRSSKQRQENMLKTLAATEEKLRSLQEFNKGREEALHVIRKNSEIELKFLIDKYDEDMNRKQCELENLMEQFEKEKIMFIELKKNFEAQNETYVTLMAEKQEYEQTLWDQRLLEVRQKFAARKIQRCVRNYLAKLKTRGKKYGGRKKGKKAAKK